MKNFKSFLYIIMIMTFLSSTISGADKVVNFVTDSEKDGGFLIEITKAAFEKVGYKVNIEFLPWARATANVMDGTSEALLGAYYTDERATKMFFSDVIGQSDMVFFKMKNNNIKFKILEDLKPYTIGTITGAAYIKEFEDATFLKKEPVSDYAFNINKLTAGRISLFVEKKYIVLNALKTKYPQFYGEIDYLSPPLTEIEFYNGFSKSSKGSAKTVKDFNTGLKMIIKDGTYDKIMNKNLHE